MPQGFEPITILRSQHKFDTFSFTDDKFEEISGIVFILSIENLTLISYKQHYPINLYKRDSKGMGLWKSEHRLVQIPEDILKIYPDFDFFYLNDELYVDLSTKKSQNLFLKLLNDDFLSSQLTKLNYDSSSKDLVEV